MAGTFSVYTGALVACVQRKSPRDLPKPGRIPTILPMTDETK